MGLAWQQGPLSPQSAGRFLVAEPLPERLLFAEPLRRRMRVRFGGEWIADSENVVLLHEPGRYPVAYFPREDVAAGALRPSDRTSEHRDLGATRWYVVAAGEQSAERGAWEHVDLPGYAGVLRDHIAFAWRAMEAFYEEDERIVGHAADTYHRIDIRRTSRHLVVRSGETIIADTARPIVLYESGFAPRWYVPREDVVESELAASAAETFCPYKGICSYFDIGGVRRAAWSYHDAYTEVDRISGLVSFESDKVIVELDGRRLHLEPGQRVVSHGIDRDLSVSEIRAIA
ncbi:MAG: DUF427 domain-containing protein [Solirubrobacteraceae bacterium]